MLHNLLLISTLLAILLGVGSLLLVNPQLMTDNSTANLASQSLAPSLPVLPLSYLNPLPQITDESLAEFHAGKALANQPWIKAPAITENRDGLGPLHNAMTCLFCHVNGGRGKLPDDDHSPLFSTLVRLSLPGFDRQHGIIPEPTYGDQIQQQSTALAHLLKQSIPQPDVEPEAIATIIWQYQEVTYPDGKRIQLRQPKLRLSKLAYGDLDVRTLISLRNAQPLIALGLVEAIAQTDIDALTDPDDRDGDGISGRVNQVWDVEQQATIAGRFGWKANQPSVKQQTAAAFRADVGITNRLFPEENCTQQQSICRQQPTGNHALGYELTDKQLNLVTFFITQTTPLPSNDNGHHHNTGKKFFNEVGCAKCHHPQFTTNTHNNPLLSQQPIFPYSDWLLHDMGEGLADGRPDFLASGSEWRTPPLWGVGRSAKVNGSGDLLHDGRARTIEEAILWHAGEGEVSRTLFMQLPAQSRQQLIEFVETR